MDTRKSLEKKKKKKKRKKRKRRRRKYSNPMQNFKGYIILLGFLFSSPSSADLSDYTKLPLKDIAPCVSPCVRVGRCGEGGNGPCNVSWLADQCSALYGCEAFNSNGWLKGCGNISCGIYIEDSGVDSYFNTASGGMPPPPRPCPPYVAPVEDEHYPVEEPLEAAGSASPVVVSVGQTWAVLAPPGSGKPAPINCSAGDWAFGFQLLAVLPFASPAPLVVVERTFARWGFMAYVSAAGGEVARLRKGTGLASYLVMPRYSYLADANCGYYNNVYNNATDYIKRELQALSADGEVNFLDAAAYLPPQRDYASIGGILPYNKFSVSPDGRIKIADSDIYVPTQIANETGPGVLVWDPALHLASASAQLIWPATNWTYTKSALVGRFLRVVAVIGYSHDSGYGFEQVAFAPASEPAASAYIRLRASEDSDWGPFSYFNASSKVAVAPLDPQAFYAALLAEQALWNATLAPAASYTLPGYEGSRQTDFAAASLVASMSLYVGLQPNYGDGADYWSPQVERGGSLPFQEIAVVQNLIDINLAEAAGQRLGWWFDHYLKPDGELTTGTWELSCPNGFADGLSDFGQMQDIWVRVARAQLSTNPTNGSAWVSQHFDQFWRLTNYSYHLRLAAVARGDVNVTKGLIWGPPEHDTVSGTLLLLASSLHAPSYSHSHANTHASNPFLSQCHTHQCHDPGFYYHNNAWFWRGMLEAGKFLRDACPTIPVCASYVPQGAVLLGESAAFRADLEASLSLSVTLDAQGNPYFVPPTATLAANFPPFLSMVESTVAEYSNFRYYSELLGADFLSPAMSVALQEFRESHQGTVSGITRWSDHLDDMPSSYYAVSALRDSRVDSFLALQYGHMANYQGRGTGTATEQLPINADANGLWRDYLWGYLEGGIDQCVPSIMLSSIATRWQLVLERYDEDVIYLNAGAPRRWFDISGGGFAIKGAYTRFGSVGLSVLSDSAAGGAPGEDVSSTVDFSTWAVMSGVNATPAFSLRLRSSRPGWTLQPASVKVKGSATLVSVDVAKEQVLLSLNQVGGGAAQFTVTAELR